MFSLQMNYRDPRFMKLLDKERASRPYAALPTRGAATAAFVDDQMRTLTGFAGLGLESQFHKDEMRFKYKQLSMRKKMAEDEIDRARKDMWTQFAVSSATGLMSALQGYSQRKTIEANELKQEARDLELLDLHRLIAAQNKKDLGV